MEPDVLFLGMMASVTTEDNHCRPAQSAPKLLSVLLPGPTQSPREGFLGLLLHPDTRCSSRASVLVN